VHFGIISTTTRKIVRHDHYVNMWAFSDTSSSDLPTSRRSSRHCLDSCSVCFLFTELSETVVFPLRSLIPCSFCIYRTAGVEPIQCCAVPGTFMLARLQRAWSMRAFTTRFHQEETKIARVLSLKLDLTSRV
jgi:hypothetical protein